MSRTRMKGVRSGDSIDEPEFSRFQIRAAWHTQEGNENHDCKGGDEYDDADLRCKLNSIDSMAD